MKDLKGEGSSLRIKDIGVDLGISKTLLTVISR